MGRLSRALSHLSGLSLGTLLEDWILRVRGLDDVLSFSLGVPREARAHEGDAVLWILLPLVIGLAASAVREAFVTTAAWAPLSLGRRALLLGRHLRAVVLAPHELRETLLLLPERDAEVASPDDTLGATSTDYNAHRRTSVLSFVRGRYRGVLSVAPPARRRRIGGGSHRRGGGVINGTRDDRHPCVMTRIASIDRVAAQGSVRAPEECEDVWVSREKEKPSPVG